MTNYKKTKDYWDEVFNQAKIRKLDSEKSGYPLLDDALDWLSEPSSKVLDFGSGSGAMLAYLAKRTKGHYYGIDVSLGAVTLAKELFELNQLETGYFEVGDGSSLKRFNNETFDAVILSNVLDNMQLNDAMHVLEKTTRMLKKEGKLLIKLNPYFDKETITDLKLEHLDKDLYLESSGLYLLNKTDDFWLDKLSNDYNLYKQTKIYFTDDHYNRMYLCIKKN